MGGAKPSLRSVDRRIQSTPMRRWPSSLRWRAMSTMARHLSELGHRRIGVLCMRLSTDRNDGFAPPMRQERARYEVQRRRLAGLREGFSAAGVDWTTVPVVERFDHSE